MKVSELSGPLLAYWVARAQGRENIRVGDGVCSYSEGAITYQFFPHERWDHGGPIIERERIMIAPHLVIDADGSGWKAAASGFGYEGFGATPLVAAMRCFVASRYREEVPDE